MVGGSTGNREFDSDRRTRLEGTCTARTRARLRMTRLPGVRPAGTRVRLEAGGLVSRERTDDWRCRTAGGAGRVWFYGERRGSGRLRQTAKGGGGLRVGPVENEDCRFALRRRATRRHGFGSDL
ncbi:hypothetical protein E5676_scaffold108G00230 [Cucumis melo var. makuwa]|uniref:Uncharacterized protein n=1 Tax=Cucumis melo var. makuwa TaxID=1194695 RepID=A0A5D3C1Z1_CUCMM|nr:hypothetical protein E5676_scaffold108G00230 [Cucumis melo var. makuwa]